MTSMSRCLFKTGIFGRAALLSRVFFAVTPPRLYARVLLGSLKSSLGLLSPASAVVGLTYRCQLDCRHCSAGLYEKRGPELTAGELEKLFGGIAELGVPRVNLTGGEALLRPDLPGIVAAASRRFVTVLESNGIAEDAASLRRLKAAGLSCLAVSLDSPDAAAHDAYRGRAGLFAKAVETVRAARREGLPCLISTYMTNENLSADTIGKFRSLYEETGALAVRVMPARPVGNFSCAEPLLLNPENERFLLDSLDPSAFYFKGLPGPEKCGIFSRNTFYVSPYGEVQPCAYLPMSFGSVREKPLRDILGRMWASPVFAEAGTRDCLALHAAFREKHFGGGGKLPVDAA